MASSSSSSNIQNESFKTNGLDFSIINGTPLKPKPSSSSSSPSSSLRIVSYNMASGNAGPAWQFSKGSGADQHQIREQLIETMLLESKADVICVQESVVKYPEWTYRSIVPTHPKSNATKFVSTTSKATQQQKTPSTNSAATAAVVSSAKNNDMNDENTASVSVFVRSKEFALTHCGLTFLYFNKNTCEILREGKINGCEQLPDFPVIAVRKKRRISHPSQTESETGEAEDSSPIFIICSVHLHPFPHMFNKRKNQFTKLVSELDRIESVWKLSPSFSKRKIFKIIAGDTNMTNEQFPSDAVCARSRDCLYEYKCSSQFPPARFFSETEPWVLNSNTPVVKFFTDCYTFGGDNDYNQSGMVELRRFQISKGPFYMRYDRAFILDDDNSSNINNNNKIKEGNSNNSSSTKKKNLKLKVQYMQRCFDGRFVINSGNGYIDFDSFAHNQRPLRIGDCLVKDEKGRLLSDHFGILVDFEVVQEE